MFGKDQRGYILSGLGMLLLIPVMIIIPIFIAVETQSSDIPTKMVTSDTTYRTFSDIKIDIKNQIFTFGNKINDQIFKFNDITTITHNIDLLYNSISEYPNIFKPLEIKITPNYQPSISGSWDVNGGNALLNDGLNITFQNTSAPYIDTTNNRWFCNYTATIGTNMNITVTNGPTNGHSQIYAEAFSYNFKVDSDVSEIADRETAINHFTEFFNDIRTFLSTK